MFQIAENEIAYLLGAKIHEGFHVETYVVRKPDMTPITQVQVFKTYSAGWVAWTGNLTRAENQARAKKIAEMRNRE